MKPALLNYLACPRCAGRLTLEKASSVAVHLSPGELKTVQETGRKIDDYATEITEGVLTCKGCMEMYPIVNSIPRLYREAANDFKLTSISSSALKTPHKDERHVQRSFSKEWEELNYDDGLIWIWTKDSRITTFCEEVRISSPEKLKGKRMVDAGCGSAIMSMTLAERCNVEIVALDMASVLDRAQQHNKSNFLHLVQGSVLNPPLRAKTFDLVYSHGVLHHTYDTRVAFDAIEPLTKDRGALYVWLYGKKRGWNRFRFLFIRSARFFIARLPDAPQRFMIHVMYHLHSFVRLIKRKLGREKVEYKTKQQKLVGIRDKYTPKYAREHRETEVISWFLRRGYEDVNRRTNWPSTPWWRGSTDLSIIGYKNSTEEHDGKIFGARIPPPVPK